GGEVVELDLGPRRGIRAPDADMAAALRAKLADRRGEAREGMQLVAHLGGAEIDEVALHVGRGEARIAAEERAGIARAHRQRPLAVERILPADAEAAQHAGDVVVERDRLRAA